VSNIVHSFNEQLAYSERASCEPFWDAVYKKAFPNLVNHMMCKGDTASQRMGVDRILYLANGLTVAIDEKKTQEGLWRYLTGICVCRYDWCSWVDGEGPSH
jgi:hypothetical protein